MSEIKPCPFCGAAPLASEYIPDHVHCQHVMGGIYRVDAWNTRPIEDAIVTRVAQLEAELAAAKAEAEGWLGVVNICYQQHMCYREEITRDRNANITAIETQCLYCERWNEHADDCYVLRYEDMIERDEAQRETEND